MRPRWPLVADPEPPICPCGKPKIDHAVDRNGLTVCHRENQEKADA